jgi:protein-L-isoaspartate(D-aspartate) O-methyltransferase
VPLDGRIVKRIKLSAQVQTNSVRQGLDRNELPAVAIRFYDQSRTLLATQFLGPFQGTANWRQESRNFRVPQETREAIVAVGLFGATGVAAFDKIEVRPVGR